MTPAERAPFDSWQRIALLIGIAAALISAVGWLVDRDEFLRSYLFAWLFWTGLALGCLGILLLHHTVGGKWGMVIRRMCEAASRTIPGLAILFIPILLNLPSFYPWAMPGATNDPAIHAKAAYLNAPALIGRTVIYFAIWSFYGYRLSVLSKRQDGSRSDSVASRELTSAMKVLAAPGLVVFTFSASFAFIDWVMSLEPDWFSTIFGAMFLMGQVLSGFAFTIGLAIILSRVEPLRSYVTKQHLHDLANMMFAFMILWAYCAFSQFLIIWSGNLPKEIPWYLRRFHGGWGSVAVALVVFHFAAPFALLLTRAVKRHANRLLGLCALMLLIRMIDVYWLVEPAFYGRRIQFHWTDISTLVAVGGLWIAAFFWQLRSAPLLPVRDAQFAGAPRETVAF